MFVKQMLLGIFCILCVGMHLVGCGADVGAPPDTTNHDGVGPVDMGADIVLDTTPTGTDDGGARIDFSRLFVSGEASTRDIGPRFPNLVLVNVSVEDQNGQTLATAVATKAAPTVNLTIPLAGMTKTVRFVAIGRNAAGSEISRAMSNFTTAQPGATLVVALRLSNTVPAVFGLLPAAGSTVGTTFLAGVSTTDLAGTPSTQITMNGLMVDGVQVGNNPRVTVMNAPVGIVMLNARVTSPSGGESSVSWQVMVATTPPANQPPVASFTATPTSGEAPLTVNFDASASNDPDGQIVLYHWTIDGNTLDDGSIVGTVFDTAGDKVVSLTITDDDGATATAVVVISVSQTGEDENLPPTLHVDFVPPLLTGAAPLLIAMTATVSDPDGDDVTVTTNWGDGTVSVGTSVSHIYATSGSFTVTVVATDSRGATTTFFATVVASPSTAENSPPVLVASVAPTTGDAPLTVVVDATGTSDPDGDVFVVETDWGEGGTTSVGTTVSHTFSVVGTFTVTAVATDSHGATDTQSETIEVGPAPPEVLPGFEDFLGVTRTFYSDDPKVEVGDLGLCNQQLTVASTSEDDVVATVQVALFNPDNLTLYLYAQGELDLTTGLLVLIDGRGWQELILNRGNGEESIANLNGSCSIRFDTTINKITVSNMTVIVDGVFYAVPDFSAAPSV